MLTEKYKDHVTDDGCLLERGYELESFEIMDEHYQLYGFPYRVRTCEL